MSLRTVRYLSCDYCDRRWVRVECPEPGETVLPAGWLAVPLAGGKVQHCCPDCWKRATVIRQPPLIESLIGLALLSDAANDAPPYNFSFAPPTPLDPKISAAKFIYQPGLLAPYKVPLGPTNAG